MTRQELMDYIFDAYSVEPDYPFPRDDVTCVFRHADNRKWFGIAREPKPRWRPHAWKNRTWLSCSPGAPAAA